MEIDNKKYSKMMQQYLETKAQHPGCILFYRLGDFYEMFFEDAINVSSELGLTLTARDCGSGQKAPMCGVPFHSAHTYIARLANNGHKIAICEQLTTSSKNAPTNAMIERGVVRVITPGTIMDESLLHQGKNNYIASVFVPRDTMLGLAWIDLSTGEFNIQQFVGENALGDLSDNLVGISPSEIIGNRYAVEKSTGLTSVRMGVVPQFSQQNDEIFEYDSAYKYLTQQLNIKSLQGLNCEDKPQAVCAGGALLEYLIATQMRDLKHINKLNVVTSDRYMHLDINTRMNLELCETMYDRKKRGSLLWVLDHTKTTMGARLLRSWLELPLQDVAQINARLDAVEELSQNMILRSELQEALSNFQDIERLCGRVSFGNLNPRNCEALGLSLAKLPHIKSLMSKLKSSIMVKSAKKVECYVELAQKLQTAFVTEPPTSIRDGGFIREGYSEELDKLISAKSDGQKWIAQLEAKEREATGERKLKILYNRIAGYYIEVPKATAINMPSRFQKVQTMATTERFSTNELRQLEDTINNAEERKLALELQLFDEIRQEIMQYIPSIQQTAKQIALLDCLLSLAHVAVQNDYTRPVFCDNNRYEIIESRHPVVERLMTKERFVPNDVLFNDEQRTIIITGPNMAGKSTYMRQIALIVLMAHIGCFVPARSAKVSLTDRIFTRIGASDNLGMGQSTFMVEMSEVANIIKNATKDSLLILDEIGRGTSTQDGMSIAWAVLEYIASSIKARTLFSTHYHRLTDLQGKLPGVVNMKVTVSEFDNQMTFLRKVEYGSSSQSFGIEVAKLAGIPDTIIRRAKEVMQSQEIEHNKSVDLALEQYTTKDLGVSTKYEIIEDILNKTDINNLTPLEAMSKLAELKKKISD